MTRKEVKEALPPPGLQRPFEGLLKSREFEVLKLSRRPRVGWEEGIPPGIREISSSAPKWG
jgi:hypothetical protein